MADRRRNVPGGLSYAEAGERGRRLLRRAARLNLTAKEHRVLEAVLGMTLLYSRTSDHTYLAHLAAHAHGVDRAERWQMEKTRKALKRLRELDMIDYRAPKGRPNQASEGPSYWVSIVEIDEEESSPETGGDLDGTQPVGGLDSGQEMQPDPVANAARLRAETQPAHGGPTEESSEKCSEQPPHDDPSARKDTFDEDVKAEARRRWESRNRGGEQLGIGVLRLIENDVRKEWAERDRPDLTQRDLLESYVMLGRNRATLGVTEDDLGAELAGDPNVMRFPDLLAAAMAGLQGKQVVC